VDARPPSLYGAGRVTESLAQHRRAPADAPFLEDPEAGLTAADAAGIDAVQVLPQAVGGRWATWAMLNEALGA